MTPLNVLIVGGGGREHAIAWKLRQSPGVDRLYCAPGNGGTVALADAVPIAASDVRSLTEWVVPHQIGLVVVGPEEPLALGLADHLRAVGVPVLGPGSAGARLESSKSWAKRLLREVGVPTAASGAFADTASALAYARAQRYPLVVKADGLAAGKGVVIARDEAEAEAAIRASLEGGAFGEAGRILVIEEFLEGAEVSLIAFVDGPRVASLVLSRDHKRIGEGDTGPNTGGMGAIAPSHAADRFGLDRLRALILDPVAAALHERGILYRGVLYAGVMLTTAGPKVLELNCRLGDPEAQVILPLLGADLAELAYATALGELSAGPLPALPGYRCGVVLASGGYPGPYQTGYPIDGLDRLDADALAFHAGTRRDGERLVTAGGRVLTIVGQGDTLQDARRHAYANVARVSFAGCSFRRDIGARELEDPLV